MSTIYLYLPVDTDEVIDNVCASEEEDFLLDVLKSFDSNNVNAAIRNYFECLYEEGDVLPDYVNAEKLWFFRHLE